MKWRVLVGVSLTLLAITVITKQEEKDDQQPQSSIARAQWQDVQHPKHETVKGYEDKEEEGEEQARRVRVRNGAKRRRRLRKRPRTTTPPTEEQVQEDNKETQHPGRGRWSQEDPDYPPVDEDFRPYRRRPGKRRRRPLRKQQYEEQGENTDNLEEEYYRRRRKGNRKRIRIQEAQVTETGAQEEQTLIKNNHQTIETKVTRTEPTPFRTSSREEVSRSQPNKQLNRQEESVLSLAATRRQHFEQSTTTVRSKSEETETNDDIRPIIKQNRFQEKQKDKTQKQDLGERKENRADIFSKENKDYSRGEKVFDRKALFSSSRRLPQTSAVIRRRLRPKNGTSSIKTENLVPKGYNKQMPEIIPPYKLIEEMMSTRSTTEKDSSEEPNYPKTQEPRTKIIETTPRAVIRTSTQRYNVDDQNMYTTIEEFFKVGKEPQTTTTTTSTTTSTTMQTTTEREILSDDNDSLENFNIANVEDHILDLLLTKNSSSRLAKILELRNMTLIQLIQHRERGSSQLHFSGNLNKHNDTTVIRNDITEDNDADDSEVNSSVETSIPNNDNERNPRIFESLPDFNKKPENNIETKTQPYPTWSVIPNPDLTPVSVNKFDEIPVITRATVEPVYTNNIEEIILIEDNTIDRFPGTFNLNLANKISDGIKTFKKFPPGVKSAIIVSLGILVLAIIGFLSVLISCRVRQKRSRLRAKRDVLNEQLHTEEFMNSQRSLSPVLNKNQATQPSFTQGIHSNTASNRHYYLWRTLRKTFQYD